MDNDLCIFSRNQNHQQGKYRLNAEEPGNVQMLEETDTQTRTFSRAFDRTGEYQQTEERCGQPAPHQGLGLTS